MPAGNIRQRVGFFNCSFIGGSHVSTLLPTRSVCGRPDRVHRALARPLHVEAVMYEPLECVSIQITCAWATKFAVDNGIPCTVIYWRTMPDGERIYTLWEIK